MVLSRIYARRGIMTLTVHGKRSKIRYLPMHPRAVGLVQDYLDAAGHGLDVDEALFSPVKRPDGTMESGLTSSSVYRNKVMKYAKELGISVEGFGPQLSFQSKKPSSRAPRQLSIALKEAFPRPFYHQ